MANTIKIKRSAVQGKAPAVGDLSLGELALNTYDGKLYTLKNSGTSLVVEIGGSAFTGYITENTGDGTFWNVVTQKDVGYAANQVPLNQYLGQLAFLDAYSPAGLRRTGGGSDDVVVSSGGLVGIGTTNPAEKLEVTGNITVSANSGSFRQIGAADSSNTTLVLQGGGVTGSGGNIELGRDGINYYDANTQVFRNVNASSEYGRFAATGEFLLGTATVTGTASQPLQVTGGAYVSGNLGIGVIDPTYKLHVAGDIKSTQALHFGTGGTYEAGTIYSDANWGAIIRANTTSPAIADFMITNSADVRRFRIDTSGNVIIPGNNTATGTASQPLQVTGGAYISGNLGIGNTNPTFPLTVNGNLYFEPNSNGYISGDDSSQNGLNGSFLLIGTSGNSIDAGVHLRGGQSNTNDWSIYQKGSDNSLRIKADNATEPFVITNNGDVGVGTINPTSKLHVVGDVKVLGVSTFTNANNTAIQIRSGASGSYTALGIGRVAEEGTFAIASGAGIYANNAAAGDVVIRNNNASGKVLFSRAGANASLAIDGDNVLVGTVSATGTASQPLQVAGGGYFSGNVGIGTTNPAYKLEVNGDIKVGEEGTLWFSNVANSIEKIASTNSTIDIYADGQVRFFESDANVQKFVFDVNNGIALINGTTASGTAKLQVTGNTYINGYVGIGTTSPSGGVDIRTAPQWSSSNLGANLVIGGTRNNAIGILDSSNSNPWAILNGSGNLIISSMPALGDTTTGANEKIRIDSTGNVGIGNINPGAKLDVSGDIRLSAVDPEIEFNTGGPRLRVPAANTLAIHTGGGLNTATSELVRITSTGVGIATTNPVSTFQIKDTLTFETTTTTTTSTSQLAVDTFAAATFRSAKYQVQVTCPGQVATLGSITNGGTGYTAGTFNVTFSNSSGTGAGAQGTVVISNGTVGAVEVGTTGGTGYTAGDVLTASGGSGFQVAVGTVNGSGTILTFGAISAAGSGYTAGVGIGTTTLTLLGGTGTGATATATINDGVITSSTLLQQPTTGTGGTVFYAGSNYTTSTVLTIAKGNVTNTIITIADSGGVSVFTSLTAHGVGVNDIVRVSSTANGLTTGTDYYVVTAPTTTTFTLGTTSGVGTTFTNGTSLSIGFYRNSAIAGSTVAYLNAISAISTSYQVSDLMVLHDGATADYVEYATIATRDVLGTFAADISSSNARLLFTPTYTTNTVKVARQAITL